MGIKWREKKCFNCGQMVRKRSHNCNGKLNFKIQKSEKIKSKKKKRKTKKTKKTKIKKGSRFNVISILFS